MPVIRLVFIPIKSMDPFLYVFFSELFFLQYLELSKFSNATLIDPKCTAHNTGIGGNGGLTTVLQHKTKPGSGHGLT